MSEHDKHSPGPWMWAVLDDDGEDSLIDAEGAVVFEGGPFQLSAADAELIASAPTLAAENATLRAQLAAATKKANEVPGMSAALDEARWEWDRCAEFLRIFHPQCPTGVKCDACAALSRHGERR